MKDWIRAQYIDWVYGWHYARMDDHAVIMNDGRSRCFDENMRMWRAFHITFPIEYLVNAVNLT